MEDIGVQILRRYLEGDVLTLSRKKMGSVEIGSNNNRMGSV